MFSDIHHIAIIGSDYQRSKHFYAGVLGFEIINETYREERNSYKLDLKVNDHTQLELFSFPDPPSRLSNPESCGLRHLAFAVDDIQKVRDYLLGQNIEIEETRIDLTTGKEFFFFKDPDNLPLEIYKAA